MSAATPGTAAVLLYHLTDDLAAGLAAYHESSARMSGTPGLLGDEFLRPVGAEDRFTVVSHWESLEAFLAWESSPGHKEQTAPLRPFRDLSRERPFEIYEVAASYAALAPRGV